MGMRVSRIPSFRLTQSQQTDQLTEAPFHYQLKRVFTSSDPTLAIQRLPLWQDRSNVASVAEKSSLIFTDYNEQN